MNKRVIIDNDTTPWRFVEKEEDGKSCVVKNINNNDSYEGLIESISSKGKYVIKVIRYADKQ